MKIDKEKIDKYEFLVVDEDTTARVAEADAEGFKKLMVLYRHKQPVWAHRDCRVQEEEKSKKPQKRGLTKKKSRV